MSHVSLHLLAGTQDISPVVPALPNKIALPDDSQTPPARKQLTVTSSVVVQVDNMRLPVPCPLPTTFSKICEESLQSGQLIGKLKLRMLRESAQFYYGLCPKPTPAEYNAMAKTLCDKYVQLQDKQSVNGEYWVSYYT